MATHWPLTGLLTPRTEARVIAIDCYISALQKGGDMGDAVKLFDMRCNTAARTKAGTDVKSPEHFVPYQVKKLYERGTLHDIHEQPHTKKMPDAQGLLCCKIVAAPAGR